MLFHYTFGITASAPMSFTVKVLTISPPPEAHRLTSAAHSLETH